MIRNKPKTSTSKIGDAWVEQVVFINSAPDSTDILNSNCKNAWQELNSLKYLTFRNSTNIKSCSDIYDHATQARWEIKVNSTPNVPVISDLKTPKNVRHDEVQDAKRLIYNWEKSHQGKFASFYSVYFVETMYKNREYEEINRLLNEVEVSELTEWSMVALLRSSFQAKKHLPAWPRLLNSVVQKLKSDGKDYNRLLSGLIR